MDKPTFSLRFDDLVATGTVLAQHNEPFMIVGPPGVGKTAAVQAIAQRLGADLLNRFTSIEDPTDPKGLPWLMHKPDGTVKADFVPFADTERLYTADTLLVCFLDDFGQAPPATQAPYMQLLHAREWNGRRVSPYVRFVLATNRRQEGCIIIPPVIDRMAAIFQILVEVESWTAWAAADGCIDPRMIAFLRVRPDLILTEPKRGSIEKWCTPRSWHTLGRLLLYCLPVTIQLTEAVIGSGAGAEVVAFCRNLDILPTREDIYTQPNKAKVPQKPDLLYAVSSLLAHGATLERMAPTIVYLNRLPPEYAVLCLKDIKRRDVTLLETPAFDQWASQKDHAALFGL